MPKTLRKIQVKEISLARAGRNKQRVFMLKERGSDMSMQKEIRDVLLTAMDTPIDEKIEKQLESKLGKASQEAVWAAKVVLRLLEPYKDELPADIFRLLGETAGYGYPLPKEEGKEKEQANSKLDKLPDNVRKEVESLLKERDSELEKLRKEHEQLKSELEKERAARKRQEMLHKVEKEFGSAFGKPEDLAELLLKLDSVDPKLRESVESLLKRNKEMLDKSAMLKELGTADDGTLSTASEKLEKLAKEHAAKHGISFERAFVEVAKQNPELAKEAGLI